MLCFPNCKINLGLFVTEKRPDGYHNLETVFYPVHINDVLEIAPGPKPELHITGLEVAGNTTNNLVWKAYMMLKEEFTDRVPPAEIYLHKVIPMGAGMGGGSADGAFMLRLVNNTFKLGLSDESLAERALQLGSDCPFFIYNSPQYARGRGELMEPVGVDLSGYTLHIVCPDVHVSTKEAFGMIQPKKAPVDLKQIGSMPVGEWKGVIYNDFEASVFKAHPVLADIKQQLYDSGAVYASMSGSGSAIYGVYPKGSRGKVVAAVGFKEFFVG